MINPALTQYARAKINLFLHVIGKRDDGYHLLQGLFARISVADRITVIDSNTISCSVTGSFHVYGENIVLRAAKALHEEFYLQHGVHIDVEKNIPVAAGLGGGSSDAATALLLLSKHWKLDLTYEKLNLIGLKLGADIPFFLQENNAFVEGIGEIITPIALNRTFELLLINTGEQVSTVHIYKNYKPKSFSSRIECNTQNILSNIMDGRNDLEEIVLKLYPDIEQVLNILKDQQGCMVSRISGSGATCFGIFNSKDNADKAFKILSDRFKYWWIMRETLHL